MKCKNNIHLSAKARLNQVIRESERLNIIAQQLKLEFQPESMAQARKLAQSILQSFHEYNAYSNLMNEQD